MKKIYLTMLFLQMPLLNISKLQVAENVDKTDQP